METGEESCERAARRQRLRLARVAAQHGHGHGGRGAEVGASGRVGAARRLGRRQLAAAIAARVVERERAAILRRTRGAVFRTRRAAAAVLLLELVATVLGAGVLKPDLQHDDDSMSECARTTSHYGHHGNTVTSQLKIVTVR